MNQAISSVTRTIIISQWCVDKVNIFLRTAVSGKPVWLVAQDQLIVFGSAFGRVFGSARETMKTLQTVAIVKWKTL
jgi:hypothetical protein